jgi:hypothetical protein
VEALNELKGKFGYTEFSAQAETGIQINEFPELGENGLPERWGTLVELSGSMLRSYIYRKAALTLSFYRGGRDQLKSPVFDEITLAYSRDIGGEISESDRLSIASFINHRFKVFDPERVAGGANTPESKHMEAIHESTLSRLEQVAEKVIAQTTEANARLQEQYLEKQEELRREHERSKNELLQEHANRMANLDAKEEELKDRQASIDDSDNTYARRETRNRMLQDVKERILDFGVSRKTERKRFEVIAGFLMLFVVLGLLLAWSIGEASLLHDLRAQALKAVLATPAGKPAISTESIDKFDLYLVWARISVLTVGLVLSLLYYIRWQNRWADQHATAEFQLQQFYIDVNRANWVVESGLEWHKETGATIPGGIMESLTKNLFRYADELPPALHPADELASALLGSASKLKLKAGDSELEFDKPGKIKEKEAAK